MKPALAPRPRKRWLGHGPRVLLPAGHAFLGHAGRAHAVLVPSTIRRFTRCGFFAYAADEEITARLPEGVPICLNCIRAMVRSA